MSHRDIISVLASKAGLQKPQEAHPDVHVTVNEVDDILSKDGIIIPGLGDAGNRLYKTPTIDQDDDEKLLSPSKRKRTLSK
jgi:uracil phosphoribosyltransferase